MLIHELKTWPEYFQTVKQGLNLLRLEKMIGFSKLGTNCF